MRLSMQARTVQWLGRLAAVGAVVLLLAGSAAPAEALRRAEAIKRANAFVNRCLAAGGTPAVEHGQTGNGGGYSSICDYQDGSSIWVWYPYNDHPGYEPPEWERAAARSAIGGEQTLTADARGHAAADVADHGRQKAHKQHKHKHHAGTRR